MFIKKAGLRVYNYNKGVEVITENIDSFDEVNEFVWEWSKNAEPCAYYYELYIVETGEVIEGWME